MHIHCFFVHVFLFVFFFVSQADKYGVPRMCFINKMDRTGANFYRAVQMIKVGLAYLATLLLLLLLLMAVSVARGINLNLCRPRTGVVEGLRNWGTSIAKAPCLFSPAGQKRKPVFCEFILVET